MKWLIVALLLLLVAGNAHAADAKRTPYTSCDADRYRFCNSATGIPAILACLQQHRPALSKACAALLLENGR
jgi:hypothetical protein